MRAAMLILPALLAGCATGGDYEKYLAAQAAVTRAAVKDQKPLLEIVGVPGQPITGLASIRVYAPQELPRVEQARPNEWAAVASTALQVAAPVVGAAVTLRQSTRLAQAVGQAATHGYQYVQAPAPNQVITGDGNVIGGGTGGSVLNGTGAVGGDYTDDHSTTTTTTTTTNTTTTHTTTDDHSVTTTSTEAP